MNVAKSLSTICYCCSSTVVCLDRINSAAGLREWPNLVDLQSDRQMHSRLSTQIGGQDSPILTLIMRQVRACPRSTSLQADASSWRPSQVDKIIGADWPLYLAIIMIGLGQHQHSASELTSRRENLFGRLPEWMPALEGFTLRDLLLLLLAW